jgi:hypothetical protein
MMTNYSEKIQALIAEREALKNELERERMRLAACGCVALADTPESAAYMRNMHPDYRSASCDDVARRVDECMSLRKDAERYRFLRGDFSVMGANIDGQHSWAYRRNFSLRGPTLDAAIDTAMGAPPVSGAA